MLVQSYMMKGPLVKRAALGAGILAVLIAASGVALPLYRSRQFKSLIASALADPRTHDMAEMLQKSEAKRAANPNDVTAYLEAGLAWKSIAEVRGDRTLLARARDVYEVGFALFGEKNTILALNAANLNAELGAYDRADALYQAAVRNDPGFQEGHLAYLEFLKTKKKAPAEDIILAYEKALKSLIDNATVFQGFGYYLYETGDYARAIPFLEVLANRYPNDAYRRMLDEAREKVRMENAAAP